MGMRSNNNSSNSNKGGEIVQVEGGHIVRSTGRKDRHSKVYTAKGPRDRRVRLSAHTAIEFYDVQDRLGYDRPSKAVDWLIKKAKPSIDKLAELPPWQPPLSAAPPLQDQEEEEEEGREEEENHENNNNNIINQQFHSSSHFIQIQQQQQQNIETDPIAFFPTSSATPSMNFQNYPHEMISRTGNNNVNPITEDLGLSLHSFQQAPPNQHQGSLFGAGSSNNVGFESHYQKIVAWNNEAATMDINRVGFMVNPQQNHHHHHHHPFLGSGTLQSSFPPPSLRSWGEIPMNPNSSEQQHSRPQQLIHHASIFGSRFVSDGLAAGFCIPANIQGDQENHHGVASNTTPSSASPHSHH